MALLSILLIIGLFTSGETFLHGIIAKHQTPHAFIPMDSIKFPQDHCRHFDENEEFDYVVVGAGPGGSVVARRLAEDPEIKVLLLEAGGNPGPISCAPALAGITTPDKLWHFRSVDKNFCTGLKKPGCQLIPGKGLGGSSLVNFMMYVRGNRLDYDDWAKIGCKGWSYEEVLPYFLKQEKYSVHPLVSEEEFQKLNNSKAVASKKYHGTDGPIHHARFKLDPQTNKLRKAIKQALIQEGIKYNVDVNGANQMGVTDLGGMVDPMGLRNSAAKGYLLNIPDNLKVCKHALAETIELRGKTADGIKFQHSGGMGLHKKYYTAKATREYIISAGALNTPPLLERSGIGRKEVLEKAGVKLKHELRGVGENYQDHMTSGMLFQVDFNTLPMTNMLSIQLTSLTTFLNITDPTSDAPDLQYILKPYVPSAIGMALNWRSDITRYVDLHTLAHNVIFFFVVSIRHPNPGHIHITQAKDPNISPEILTNHLTTELEQDRIVEGTRLARKIMSSDVMKPHNPKPIIIPPCQKYEYNSKEEILCGMRHLASSLYHHAGVTAMGPEDNPNSVVDPTLKVIGLEKLRIVDSGVMPITTRGNTEIPTIMVAEKAADMIKADRNKKK